jgi:hypothetical protein
MKLVHLFQVHFFFTVTFEALHKYNFHLKNQSYNTTTLVFPVVVCESYYSLSLQEEELESFLMN